MYNIRSVCSTAAVLLGLEPFTDAPVMDEVVSLLPENGANPRAERILMYNPDAVAWWIFEKYRDLLAPALSMDPLVLTMESVMPSVTPVCFASMYSGLMPADHGIRRYTTPVLTVKTLFDAMIEAGLKPAVCSTGTDSISMIFRNRDMDYFIFDTPEEVNDKAEELIRADRHHLIVAYNGNYDGSMHRVGPEGGDALAALSANAAAWKRLCGAAEEAWAERRWVSAFATDHGCHPLPDGRGSHGEDRPEDMNVVHMWRSGR